MVCFLSFFEGLGWFYFTDFAAAVHRKTTARFDISSGRNNPYSTGVKLKESNEDLLVGDRPIR